MNRTGLVARLKRADIFSLKPLSEDPHRRKDEENEKSGEDGRVQKGARRSGREGAPETLDGVGEGEDLADRLKRCWHR